jgi:hypothetical protein
MNEIVHYVVLFIIQTDNVLIKEVIVFDGTYYATRLSEHESEN